MKKEIQGQFKLFEDQLSEVKPEILGKYYFLFRPEEKLYLEIMKLKNLADSYLGENNCSWRLPHISLFQFPWIEREEQSLIHIIENLLHKYNIPKLLSSSIEKYNSGTVYIKLENQTHAQNFRNYLLGGLLIATGYNHEKPLKIKADLHATIAKDLGKKLELLYSYLKPFEFEPIEFKSTLVLLKKSSSGKKWEKVIEFDF